MAVPWEEATVALREDTEVARVVTEALLVMEVWPLPEDTEANNNSQVTELNNLPEVTEVPQQVLVTEVTPSAPATKFSTCQ